LLPGNILPDIINKKHYDQPTWRKKFKNEHNWQKIEKKVADVPKRVAFFSV